MTLHEYRRLHSAGVTERRFINGSLARRAASAGAQQTVVAGYAAKFGERSESRLLELMALET